MGALRKIANKCCEDYGKSQLGKIATAELGLLVYDLFQIVFQLIRSKCQSGVAL